MFTGDFSGLFAPMWNCKQHGDMWHIEEVEEIDTVNDDVYTLKLCPHCHQSVTPLYHDGLRVMHPLTDEQAYWEQMNAEAKYERDEPQWETPEEWLDEED
jgi:hypothetical protein